MPVSDPLNIKHISTVIRHQIEQEYKDLTAVFLIHGDKDTSRAVEKVIHGMEDEPAGDAISQAFKHNLTDEMPQAAFIGIIERTLKRFLVFPKKQFVILIALNQDRINTLNEARNAAHKALWRGLALYRDIHDKKSGSVHRNEALYVPDLNETTQLRWNMLEDVFAAILPEMMGQKGYINKTADEICNKSLTPAPGYLAEEYPFPVALDAVHAIYAENAHSKSGDFPIRQSWEMTKETGEAIEDTALYQWRDFALPAQELAWLGYDKGRILNLASYTSENAHIRATSFLVSETLGLTTRYPGSVNEYNAFAVSEVNARLHKKLCAEAFEIARNRAQETDDKEQAFKAIAAWQYKKLKDGEPLVGWCPLALIKAGECLRPNHEQEEQDAAAQPQPFIEARKAFDAEIEKIPWRDLAELSRIIAFNKRAFGQSRIDEIPENLKGDTAKHALVQAIKEAAALPPPPPEDLKE